jgi:hypothetical protein
LLRYQPTGAGTLALNSSLIKYNSSSSGVGDLRYILNPTTTTFHVSYDPNLDYILNPQSQGWLSVFSDGNLYLNAHFIMSTRDSKPHVVNPNMHTIDITAFSRYSLLRHEIPGTTIYDIDPGVLSIDGLKWHNVKFELKTFDSGVGRFSLVAQ